MSALDESPDVLFDRLAMEGVELGLDFGESHVRRLVEGAHANGIKIAGHTLRAVDWERQFEDMVEDRVVVRRERVLDEMALDHILELSLPIDSSESVAGDTPTSAKRAMRILRSISATQSREPMT
jgi:hypothetical protein